MKQIIILLLFTTLLVSGGIKYVSKTGTNTPPFTTWQTASNSVKLAFENCDPGDTILVDVGLYHESQIVIKDEITILGTERDSVIINSDIDTILFVIDTTAATFANFSIDTCAVGFDVNRSDFNIDNCKIKYKSAGIFINESQCNITACNITELNNNGLNTIYVLSSYQSDNIYIDNCVFYSTFTNIFFLTTGNVTIKNSIFNSEEAGFNVRSLYIKTLYVYNNLFLNSGNYSVSSPSADLEEVQVVNNTFYYSDIGAVQLKLYNGSMFKNNICSNTDWGIDIRPYNSGKNDYNLYWKVNRKWVDGSTPDEHYIEADPMFVNPTLENYSKEDFYLQAHSPAIDAGDPTILDKDGTRSDMGMFGGPYGDTYIYTDLPPSRPENIEWNYNEDERKFTLNWDKNSEADIKHYNIYSDTTANFIISPTNLKLTTTDTLYEEILPDIEEHRRYKITAVDSRNNESITSSEISFLTTDLEEEKVEVVENYGLYQNYPNPFNPTTNIRFTLQEPGKVKLKVYTTTGELVKEVINQQMTKGYHEAKFTAEGLASGIYLYTIQVTGNNKLPVYNETKKMIYLK